MINYTKKKSIDLQKRACLALCLQPSAKTLVISFLLELSFVGPSSCLEGDKNKVDMIDVVSNPGRGISKGPVTFVTS